MSNFQKTSSRKDQTRENSHKISNLMFFLFRKEKNDVEQKAESSFHQPICMPQCHLSLNTVLGYFSHFVLMITWNSFILCLCGLQILFKFFWFVMIIFSARISSDSISKKWTNKHFPKEFEFFKQRKNYHHFELEDFIFRLLCFSQDKGNTSMKKFAFDCISDGLCFVQKKQQIQLFFFFLHSTQFQPKKKKLSESPQKNWICLFIEFEYFCSAKSFLHETHKKKQILAVSLFVFVKFCCSFLFLLNTFISLIFFFLSKQTKNSNQPSTISTTLPFLSRLFCSWNVDMNVKVLQTVFVSCSWHCLNWFVLSMFCVCLMFVFWFSNDHFFLENKEVSKKHQNKSWIVSLHKYNHEPYFGPHKSTTTKNQEQQINDENNLICYSFVHFLILKLNWILLMGRGNVSSHKHHKQIKFPVYHTTLQSATLWFCWQQILAWMAKTHFIPSTSSQHKLAPLFVFWKKNSKLSQKLIKTNFQKHFGRSGANWARSKVSTRFMLECSFWSHCTSATVLILHFFHLIHTKTTVCFTQVTLKPTILIITTDNTKINLSLVYNSNFSLHIHKKIRFVTWNQHVGGLVEWLLAWSLPVHVVWICVIWTNGPIHTFFVECWIWTLFYLGMINQILLFFATEFFFNIKNTKHKNISRWKWQIHLWHWQLWEKCCSK